MPALKSFKCPEAIQSRRMPGAARAVPTRAEGEYRMKRSSRAWKKRGKQRWKWRKKKMRRRKRDQKRQQA
jgi:large subunit ribosomal protein L41e